ncbi:hypothetical protein ACFYNW_12025 [Streptomyces virginiae]|uniref:hypothetical protein n=1 Tax=Streptomyces virginiae TaxID=1961 RepID=UPI0033A6AC50
MGTIVLIAVIIVASGIGIRRIHLLNARHDVRHDARIGAYRFSDPLPIPPGLPDDLPPTGGSGRGATAPPPAGFPPTPKGNTPT